MNIIFRHTLRSIKDNLGQLFVIVFTVTVVTALFFVTLTIRDVFYNLQYAMASRLPGEAQIAVTGEIISDKELNKVVEELDDVEYVDTFLELNTLLKKSDDGGVTEKVVLIEATDLKQYKERHSDKLYLKESIDPAAVYPYPELWIMESFAKELDIKIGDTVDVYIVFYSSYKKFTVTRIFESEGIFANAALNNVLTDFSGIGNHGLITNAYIKFNEDTDVDAAERRITELFNNDNITVKKAIDYDYIYKLVEGNENLITIMMFFMIALVIFILVSSYMVIFQKRTKELSVFKAAGATSGQCVLILLFEGVIYGLMGAVIGTVLGRFAMQVVQVTVIPNYAGVIRFQAYYYVFAVLLGAAVSVFSAFFPATLFVKRSVNSDMKDTKKNLNKYMPAIFGILIFVLIGCVLPMILYPKYLLYFCIPLIVDIALIIYFGASYLVHGVSMLFGKTQGVCHLASFSVRRNKSAARLSAIVGAVISFAFISVSIVSIVIGAIEPYYSHFTGDFIVQSASGSDKIVEAANFLENTYGKNDGIEDVVLLRSNKYKMQADGKEIEYTVYALDNGSDIRYFSSGVDQKQIEKLSTEENCIVISYDMSNRLGKNIGDKIELDWEGDKNVFSVVAIDTTVTKNDRVCFVIYRPDIPFEEAMIFIMASKNVSHSDLFHILSEKLQKYNCFIMLFSDWKESTNVGFPGIRLLLRLLQVLIGAVAFIGVINMTLSTLLERQREFNIYYSAGMDGKKYFLLSLMEGIIYSLSGAVIGLVFGWLMNLIMPELGKLIDRYQIVNYFPTQLFIVVGVMVALYTITYLILSVRMRKKGKIERNIV